VSTSGTAGTGAQGVIVIKYTPSTANAQTPVLLTSMSTTSTTYNDTNVTRGTTYYYAVTATNSFATGTLSNLSASQLNAARIIRIIKARLRGVRVR
jgi:hypothetical protein